MLQKIKNQNPSPDCSGNPFLEAERSRSHRKRLQRKAGLKLKRNESVLLLSSTPLRLTKTDCFVVLFHKTPRNEGLIVRIRMRFFNFFDGRKHFFLQTQLIDF